jgi:hypothetical protein
VFITREQDRTVRTIGFADARTEFGQIVVSIDNETFGRATGRFIELALVHGDPSSAELNVPTDIVPRHSVHVGSPMPRFRMHFGLNAPG